MHSILEANSTQEIGTSTSLMAQKLMEEVNVKKGNFGPVSNIMVDSNGTITLLVHIDKLISCI